MKKLVFIILLLLFVPYGIIALLLNQFNPMDWESYWGIWFVILQLEILLLQIMIVGFALSFRKLKKTDDVENDY